MAKIGFIGLGHMGLPMTGNLVKGGHSVKGFDLSPEAMKAAAERGVAAVSCMAEAAKGVDVVIAMVPEGRHSRAVFLEEGGVLDNAGKGTLLIDCSTIDVATSRAIHEAAEKAGFDMVDAPVSGGVGGAENATLTFMVGGSKEAFGRAKPVLQPMAGKIFYCGPAGNGEAVKIVNNMLLAISMIGVSEAFALGRKLGIDDRVLFDVASTSSGRCWSLDTYCPVPGPVPTSPANRDYAAGFTADMMLKDLRLAKTASEETKAMTPLGLHAEQLYAALSESGNGGLDFSGIFKMLDKPI